MRYRIIGIAWAINEVERTLEPGLDARHAVDRRAGLRYQGGLSRCAALYRSASSDKRGSDWPEDEDEKRPNYRNGNQGDIS